MGKILTFPLQWVVTRFLSQNSTVKKPLTYFHLGFKIRHSWVDSLFPWQNVRHLTNIFLKLVFPPPPLFEIANLFTISRFPLNGFPPSLFSKSKQFDSQFFIGNLRSPQKSCMRNSKRMRSSSNKYCTDQLFKKKKFIYYIATWYRCSLTRKRHPGDQKLLRGHTQQQLKQLHLRRGTVRPFALLCLFFLPPNLKSTVQTKLWLWGLALPACQTALCLAKKKSMQEWSTGKLPFKVKPI